MKTLAYIFSGIPFLMVFTFFIRPVVPYLYLLIPKVTAQNTSFYLVISGFTGAVLGLIFQVPIAIAMGFISSIIFSIYFWRCTRGHKQFETVFGENWSSHINSDQKKLMLKRR